MKTGGREVLDSTLSYNEKDLITRNWEHLKKEFSVTDIEVNISKL